MGPLYWEWIQQSQATDQLMTMLFLFGVSLMVGYYAALLLPWNEKSIKWIQRLQAVAIIGIIVLTLLAPSLVDMGIIIVE